MTNILRYAPVFLMEDIRVALLNMLPAGKVGAARVALDRDRKAWAEAERDPAADNSNARFQRRKTVYTEIMAVLQA
jgi:hypothetical protein